MKRTKVEMEKDMSEKYFQSPAIVRGTRREEDSSYKSASAADSTITFENTSERRPITQAEADAIYKRLKAECESQAVLKISKSKKKWRDDETDLLAWAIDNISKRRGLAPIQLSAADWEDIASLVPGRNASQCKYRWSQNQEKQGTKLPWTPKEDELLKNIMSKETDASWATIAEKLNATSTIKRTGKQCRERWRNHLDPDIKKEPWTEEEDITLLQAQIDCGNKWSEIAKRLKGRSENAVKNRYNMLYKKFRDENKAVHVPDVTGALEAVTDGKKEDKEWIMKLIEEKKEKLKEPSTAIEKVTKQASNLSINDTELPKSIRLKGDAKEEKKANDVKFSLIEATNQEVIENPGHYTCPNFRYINKIQERKERLIEDAEIFVNPLTRQEIFISEHGIFLYDTHGALIPLTDLSQIKKKEKMSDSFMMDSPKSYMPPYPPLPIPEAFHFKTELDSPHPPTSLYISSPYSGEAGLRQIHRANLPILNPAFPSSGTSFPSSGTAFHPPGDYRPSS